MPGGRFRDRYKKKKKMSNPSAYYGYRLWRKQDRKQINEFQEL